MQTTPLHHPTLQVAQDFAITALQSIVCEWEQDSMDAKSQANHYAAQMYQNWAVAVDLATKSLSVKFSELFLEVLRENSCEGLRRPSQSLEDVSDAELMLELAARCPEPV